jgi:hypothetical protein
VKADNVAIFRIAWSRQFQTKWKRKPMRRRNGHCTSVMAATPAVVPRPSSSFWPVVTSPSCGTCWPTSRWKVRPTAITTRLLRIGANIGTPKRRLALSSPVMTEPTP